MMPTGHDTLDSLLGGGIRGGAITDIFGPAGSGKTQLAKQLAARALASGGSVFFVDTTGKFRAGRVLEMVRASGGDPGSLERLGVMRATSSSEQNAALGDAARSGAVLVIVDSVSDLYSFEYGREDQLGLKNSLFMAHMRDLAGLAVRLGVPVVITNMIRTFDGTERENLQAAVRQFAHARIRLSGAAGGFSGDVARPGAGGPFSYVIGAAGLTDAAQAI